MLIYADVSSLYPSLGEMLGIQPYKDELFLYSELMPLIKEQRYKAKYSKQKAKDGSLKRLLNTGAYGWLGWSFGMFNDYDEAERITVWGQKVIKRVNFYAEELGGTVLKTDTDGSLIIVPEEYRDSFESEEKYIKVIEAKLNEWLHTQLEFDAKHNIVLEHDGRYKSAILFDDKSYVLVEHDGKKTIKGNTLTGRGNEPFLLEYMSNCIDHILNGQPEKMVDEYNYWSERIEHKLMTVDDVKKRQNINQSLEEYRNKIEAGQSRIAQYEAAIQADRNYIKGDVIETWVEEPEPVIKEYKTKPDKEVIPKLSAYEVIRHVKGWNGNIYRDHYKKRLDNTTKKFMVVLGLATFKKMFPEISVTKNDKKKFIAIYGLERFHEQFPKFGWTSTYYNELSKNDQVLFQQWVHAKQLPEEFSSCFSRN